MQKTQTTIDAASRELAQTTTSREIEQAASTEQELIAQRAHEKWQQRGCPIGDDQHDWYAAQAEIELEAEARLGME
jgi:hypothetical protein